MKVFNASQIREWDKYTIEHEPISSIDLMERAARACVNIILRISETNSSFIIFAGPGNNGGDGFAIARLLLEAGRLARVFHLSSPTLSTDCMVNRYQFNDIGGKITVIRNESDFPFLEKGQVIIDAIFGTGQSRSLEGIHAYTSAHINSSGLPVISIDLPSGIFSDSSSAGLPHVNASYTLSFQVPKKCFFLPENANAFGNIEILDIGLSKEFYDNENALLNTLEHKQIKSIIRPRDPYAHKGNFGEALLMAGNKGMMGASLLAASACLRTGVGKLFCAVPSRALDMYQLALPEAICIIDPNPDVLTKLPVKTENFTVVGAGPGLGKEIETRNMVRSLLRTSHHHLVLDADALNIIAEDHMIQSVPENTVITPHVGEFTRLFGPCENDSERIDLAIKKAIQHHIYIILKGRHSLIATPEGKGYINITGNPGMAKGGSGDVLTGMLTGLLAQKYSIADACKLGVFLHGKAGDLARDKYSEHSMLASDIIAEIGPAFLKLS